MAAKYTAEQRDAVFWSHLDLYGPVPFFRPELGPCWLWKMSKDYKGYGQFKVNKKMTKVHHYLLGKPPKGFVRDHLCRVRHCGRPDHTELVTNRENQRRGLKGVLAPTCCPNGHPYEGTSVYRSPSGHKYCRICKRDRARAVRLRIAA